MPERIQLQRKRGWRMPENTVKVARPGMWGNPFSSASAFQRWLETGAWDPCYVIATKLLALDPGGALESALNFRRQAILSNLHLLKGRNLACWCRSESECHADILLRMANPGGAKEND